MQSMLINPPNGYQRPIKGGSFQEERVQNQAIKKPGKSPENLRKKYRTSATASPSLKRLWYNKHHMVIEVPWRATLSFYPTWLDMAL